VSSAGLGADAPTPPFTVTTTALGADGRLLKVFGAAPGERGSLRSFPFSWTNLPAGTKVLALVLEDKSFGDFVHWLATDIDPSPGTLAEDASAEANFAQGSNDAGTYGYFGPLPTGMNVYRLTLYALSEPTDLEPRFLAPDLLEAMEGKVLATASIDLPYSNLGD